MKTQTELFSLIATAVAENGARTNTWFIDFYGHVNKLYIRYYLIYDDQNQFVSCDVRLTNEGIQEAYWFIYNRLRNK